MEINIIHEINSTMKILFRHTRVFTFLLTLLLLGGTASESYAAKVRYHILTLPFNVKNFNNSGPKYPQNIRVEALLVISDAETVGLPKEYQSPLATEFRYWLCRADDYVKLTT